jgi:hypothetical protein
MDERPARAEPHVQNRNTKAKIPEADLDVVDGDEVRLDAEEPAPPGVPEDGVVADGHPAGRATAHRALDSHGAHQCVLAYAHEEMHQNSLRYEGHPGGGATKRPDMAHPNIAAARSQSHLEALAIHRAAKARPCNQTYSHSQSPLLPRLYDAADHYTAHHSHVTVIVWFSVDNYVHCGIWLSQQFPAKNRQYPTRSRTP